MFLIFLGGGFFFGGGGGGGGIYIIQDSRFKTTLLSHWWEINDKIWWSGHFSVQDAVVFSRPLHRGTGHINFFLLWWDSIKHQFFPVIVWFLSYDFPEMEVGKNERPRGLEVTIAVSVQWVLDNSAHRPINLCFEYLTAAFRGFFPLGNHVSELRNPESCYRT